MGDPSASVRSEALPGDLDLFRNVEPNPSASKLAGSDSDDVSSGSGARVGAVRVVSPETARMRKPGLDGVVTKTSSDKGSGTVDLLVGVECGLKVEGI